MAEGTVFIPSRKPVVQAFLVEDVKAPEASNLRSIFDFVEANDTQRILRRACLALLNSMLLRPFLKMLRFDFIIQRRNPFLHAIFLRLWISDATVPGQYDGYCNQRNEYNRKHRR